MISEYRQVIDLTPYFKTDGSRNLTANLVTSGQGIRPAANSTTAIQVQQADGTAFVNFDTSNKRLGVITTAPTYPFELSGLTDGSNQSRIGNMVIGDWGAGSYAGYACLRHKNAAYTNAYAFIQDSVGNTYFNAASGKQIYFNIAASGKIYMNATAFFPNINKTMTLGKTTEHFTDLYLAGTISIDGDSNRTITLERHTTGGNAGKNLTDQAGAPKSGETNLNGGTCYVSGGISTGTGKSAVELQTATAGVSGSTDRTPTTKFKIDGDTIGVFGVTPVVRPATGGASAAFAQNSGNAVNDASTFGGYTLAQIVQALQNLGWLT